jgi:hypothetical protein
VGARRCGGQSPTKRRVQEVTTRRSAPSGALQLLSPLARSVVPTGGGGGGDGSGSGRLLAPIRTAAARRRSDSALGRALGGAEGREILHGESVFGAAALDTTGPHEVRLGTRGALAPPGQFFFWRSDPAGSDSGPIRQVPVTQSGRRSSEGLAARSPDSPERPDTGEGGSLAAW